MNLYLCNITFGINPTSAQNDSPHTDQTISGSVYHWIRFTGSDLRILLFRTDWATVGRGQDAGQSKPVWHPIQPDIDSLHTGRSAR